MFKYNDGGRAQAGFRGKASDCVARALAIATKKPYREVYDTINNMAGKPVARNGVPNTLTRKIMAQYGFKWTPVMAIGTGCTMKLRKEDLPSGTVIVKLSRHVCAVIDGVIEDTYDCTRDGSRCVYGYWS